MCTKKDKQIEKLKKEIIRLSEVISIKNDNLKSVNMVLNKLCIILWESGAIKTYRKSYDSIWKRIHYLDRKRGLLKKFPEGFVDGMNSALKDLQDGNYYIMEKKEGDIVLTKGKKKEDS